MMMMAAGPETVLVIPGGPSSFAGVMKTTACLLPALLFP